MLSDMRADKDAQILDFISTNPERFVRPFMIYSILPVTVQRRIPTLPSIRRSISDFHVRTPCSKNGATADDTMAPATPPPEYSSQPGSRDGTPSIGSTSVEVSCFRDDVSERPRSSRSLPPPTFALTGTATGIDWKSANQGIILLNQASRESIALASANHDGPATLTRQLYLHGMSYVLRSIPADLAQEELLSLQAAIPANIVDAQNELSAYALSSFSRQQEISQEKRPPNASVLHRITAYIVFQTFLLIQFLLPYIKLFISHVYRWEREHKVSQRLFNRSIMTIDEVGRRSLQLSQTVCQMNNGKVGQAINDLTIRWVQGLAGGIQQGISEGVLMFGNERNQSMKGRVEKID